MVLVPAPARMTRASRSAASNTPLFTLVLRTTSASNPAIRPGRSSAPRLGLHHALMTAGLEVAHGLVRERVGEE